MCRLHFCPSLLIKIAHCHYRKVLIRNFFYSRRELCLIERVAVFITMIYVVAKGL